MRGVFAGVLAAPARQVGFVKSFWHKAVGRRGAPGWAGEKLSHEEREGNEGAKSKFDSTGC